MNNSRLYAIVLRLAAVRRGAVPADHGDQARAALLNIIDRTDSPFAQKLHDENTSKPYTISLIGGGKRGQDGALHFGEGSTADWRFSLLCEPAFEALLKRYLLDRNLPHIRIGAVEFAITDAFASGKSHPDSGHTTIETLHERWNCPPESVPQQIILDFCSPTTFNLGTDPITRERRWRAMPDPRTLFSSLRKRWIKLGGSAPGDEFDEWVQKYIDVEPIYLRTRKVIIERGPIVAFEGQAGYRVYDDLRWMPFVHLLADLTFWTGAGYQPTRGMGQVRVIREELNDGL